MSQIKKNKKVAIVYSIINAKGEILMEVSPQSPVFYLQGYQSEDIVPGLEAALEGRKEGDELSVELPCEQAFGPYDKKLLIEIPKEELSACLDDLWVGGYVEKDELASSLDELSVGGYVRRFDEDYWDDDELFSDSERFMHSLGCFMHSMGYSNCPKGFVIKEIRKETVVLDGNHPYAGMDLLFNIKVVSVEDASITELENGYPKENESEADDDFYGERY